MKNNKEYMRKYAKEKRSEQRGIIEIERCGYIHVLVRANNKRLDCKQHPEPAYMGQAGYVLYKIKKNVSINNNSV